jgi:hypothetical protein
MEMKSHVRSPTRAPGMDRLVNVFTTARRFSVDNCWRAFILDQPPVVCTPAFARHGICVLSIQDPSPAQT